MFVSRPAQNSARILAGVLTAIAIGLAVSTAGTMFAQADGGSEVTTTPPPPPPRDSNPWDG